MNEVAVPRGLREIVMAIVINTLSSTKRLGCNGTKNPQISYCVD